MVKSLLTLDNNPKEIIMTFHMFDFEIFFNFLRKLLLKDDNGSKYRKILESFKKGELKLFGSQAQNSQYSNFHKRRIDRFKKSIQKVRAINK